MPPSSSAASWPVHPQHPHQPRGDGAALVVVGDDRVAVADPELAHPAREDLRVGQRVASLPRARGRGEPVVELDEHRAGQVAALVAARPERPSRYQRTSASTTSSR